MNRRSVPALRVAGARIGRRADVVVEQVQGERHAAVGAHNARDRHGDALEPPQIVARIIQIEQQLRQLDQTCSRVAELDKSIRIELHERDVLRELKFARVFGVVRAFEAT